MSPTPELTAERIRVSDTLEAVNDLFYRRGWTDGLPIIPPTAERVRAMLGGVARRPQDVVATLPPRWGEATLERIAINAVMAGCLPEHLPVIIAAVEAMVEREFNLLGVQATTHHCGTLAIVNGPIRAALNMNSGANAFGPGNRANAAIGRAIRLVLLNVGGGTPGRGDKSTQGHPGKYTFCVAENEEESPWEPMHVERGYAASDSTVTMIAAETPHHVGDQFNKDAPGILGMLAGTLATPGNSNANSRAGQLAVAICPEHARVIASGGLSKGQVRRSLYERAQVDLKWYSRDDIEDRHADRSKAGWLCPAGREEDILVFVVGGAGKQSAILPGWGNSYSVTKRVEPAVQQ